MKEAKMKKIIIMFVLIFTLEANAKETKFDNLNLQGSEKILFYSGLLSGLIITDMQSAVANKTTPLFCFSKEGIKLKHFIELTEGERAKLELKEPKEFKTLSDATNLSESGGTALAAIIMLQREFPCPQDYWIKHKNWLKEDIK